MIALGHNAFLDKGLQLTLTEGTERFDGDLVILPLPVLPGLVLYALFSPNSDQQLQSNRSQEESEIQNVLQQCQNNLLLGPYQTEYSFPTDSPALS